MCLFGASPDTGNLGVGALCLSTLIGIFRSLPRADVVVFDEGRGERVATLRLDGEEFGYRRIGARRSWALHRAESYWNVRLSAEFGGVANPGARALLGASTVLDISAGDSFTDLYGPKRFRAITAPKQLALDLGLPLFLLPQTYGPFRNLESRRQAQRIIRRATMAWARDQRSFQILQELLGDDFDASRHCAGVDMAFGLPKQRPAAPLPEVLSTWLDDHSKPLVGINISGLIFNDASASIRYAFKADYRRVVTQFIERLLNESECRVVLVPHVMPPPGWELESDVLACEHVMKDLAPRSDGRLAVCPGYGDPREVKWVISQFDWFCGTRMHSTIAALSCGVPTAALAYSDKTAGVFESCAAGSNVADLRQHDTDEIIECLWTEWRDRRVGTDVRLSALATVLDISRTQIESVLDGCTSTRSPGKLVCR